VEEKNDLKTSKRTTIVGTICVVYLFLTIFYYHINKHLTGIVFITLTTLIPVAFVMMAVYAIKGLAEIYRNRKYLTFKFCVPAFIAITTLTYTIFSPWRLDSEKLGSKVLLNACFEGTQNQAYIKLREDKSFELNWTGVFLYNEWFTGTYIQKTDTFYLHYETEKPFRFGDTIVNNGESLITINKFRKDSMQYFVPFYLGDCKGLN